MKKAFLTFCATVFALTTLFAQAPEAFNYQAVAREASGDAIANTAVGVQFQLHQTTAGGTVVYSESHNPTTNEHGLFSVQVGNGTPGSGTFSAIDWKNGPYFLEVGLDPAGGSNYTSMGTQQLFSVPYALHSANATNVENVSPEALFGFGNTPQVDLSCLGTASSLEIGSWPNSVAVSDNYAYVVDRNSYDLKVIDISNPLAPTLSGSLNTGTWPSSVAVSENYAYVLDFVTSELMVIDISNPALPTFSGSLEIGILPSSLAISGNYAFVVGQSGSGLSVIDISNPVAPILSGSLGIGTGPTSVAVSGNYVYVVDLDSDDLKVIDISNPAVPLLVGSLGIGGIPRSVDVSGNYAYVVDGGSNDLKVIDISNPALPVLSGDLSTGLSSPQDIDVSGNYAYVVDSFDEELKVIDVSDPAAPLLLGSLGIGSSPHSIAVSGNYAYVVDLGSGDLKVIELFCSSAVIVDPNTGEFGHQSIGGPETDPQVGANATNYIPKWNGNALVQGSVVDNGNVGIGVPNPSEKLEVNGNIKADNMLSVENFHAVLNNAAFFTSSTSGNSYLLNWTAEQNTEPAVFSFNGGSIHFLQDGVVDIHAQFDFIKTSGYTRIEVYINNSLKTQSLATSNGLWQSVHGQLSWQVQAGDYMYIAAIPNQIDQMDNGLWSTLSIKWTGVKD